MVIDPSLRLFDLLEGDDDAPALIDGERRGFSRAGLREGALAAADGLWAMGLQPKRHARDLAAQWCGAGRHRCLRRIWAAGSCQSVRAIPHPKYATCWRCRAPAC